jgi:hypothetical protein
MRAVVMGVITVAAGCYEPRFEGNCELSCTFGSDPACPGGLVCEHDSRCHTPGMTCPPSTVASCTAFGAAVPINELSAVTDFVDPALRGDMLEMLFVRGTAGDYHIHRVTRASTSDKWGNLGPVSELNMGPEETDPALTADGLDLLYVSNASGNRRVIEAVRDNVNSQFFVYGVADGLETLEVQGIDISADGDTLYYTTYSDQNVYAIQRASLLDSFQNPVVVASMVGANIYPSISHDQLELFVNPQGVTEVTRTSLTELFGSAAPTIDGAADNPEISDDDTTLVVSTPQGAATLVRSCQ